MSFWIRNRRNGTDDEESYEWLVLAIWMFLPLVIGFIVALIYGHWIVALSLLPFVALIWFSIYGHKDDINRARWGETSRMNRRPLPTPVIIQPEDIHTGGFADVERQEQAPIDPPKKTKVPQSPEPSKEIETMKDIFNL